MKNIVVKTLFCTGVLLFLLNITGLFISLRNPAIYKDKKCFSSNYITLTAKEFYQKINVPVHDRKKYVVLLTEAISSVLAIYWDDEGIDTYNLRVPLYENYLLFLASYLKPDIYLKYEFKKYYKRAIERGVGLCSQHAIIESAILTERGIPSQILATSKHVFLQALVDNKTNEWWVLGPYYGVIIPHSIYDIQHNPDIIRPFFSKATHNTGSNKLLVDQMMKVYEEQPIIYNSIKEYSPKKYLFEYIAYILKWIIPLIFVVPAGIRFIRKRNL